MTLMDIASAHTGNDTNNTGEALGHQVAGHPQALPAEEERVMDLLHEHVPLALLCDLVDPDHGLDSRGILAAEGSPDDHWWEPPTHNVD